MLASYPSGSSSRTPIWMIIWPLALAWLRALGRRLGFAPCGRFFMFGLLWPSSSTDLIHWFLLIYLAITQRNKSNALAPPSVPGPLITEPSDRTPTTSGTACSHSRFPNQSNFRNRLMVEQKHRSSERGFASMDPEKQKNIARKGGESVPPSKRSFAQDPSLASQAGRKGGASVPAEKRSFSQNHNLASEAGRKGGESVPAEKRSFSQNHNLASEAGRKGGESVPAEKRSFSQNRGLAAEAGRKGGESRSRLVSASKVPTLLPEGDILCRIQTPIHRSLMASQVRHRNPCQSHRRSIRPGDRAALSAIGPASPIKRSARLKFAVHLLRVYNVLCVWVRSLCLGQAGRVI